MSEKQRALEALARAQWRLALALTGAMMAIYFGFILLVAWAKPLLATPGRPRPEPRHPAGRAGHRLRLGAHLDLRALGQQPLRRARSTLAAGARADDDEPGPAPPVAIFWFFLFVAVTLGHHLLGRPAHPQHRALLRRRRAA